MAMSQHNLLDCRILRICVCVSVWVSVYVLMAYSTWIVLYIWFCDFCGKCLVCGAFSIQPTLMTTTMLTTLHHFQCTRYTHTHTHNKIIIFSVFVSVFFQFRSIFTIWAPEKRDCCLLFSVYCVCVFVHMSAFSFMSAAAVELATYFEYLIAIRLTCGIQLSSSIYVFCEFFSPQFLFNAIRTFSLYF